MDNKIKVGLEDEKVKSSNEINDEERQSNSMIALKDLLQHKNYVVVLDANILLKIYRSSPDYAEFVLECLDSIKDYVCIPFNVYWEYEKHRKEEYSKKQKSIKKSVEACSQLVSIIENKIKSQCNELSRNGYPDIDGLVYNLIDKVGELQDEFDSYFEEHQNLDFLNNWDEDKVLNLMNSFRKMPEPSASFIYKLCKEGEYRYKSQTPPGYKDAKKDGVSKYGDLIVWAETYEYAVLNNKNIIFVTDDVKEDWWEKLDDGRILFRKELVKEFLRKTKIRKDTGKNLKLIPLVGYDLYQAIAREFMIEAPDAISLILNATDEFFVDEVQRQVFESVWSEIAYSGTSFIDENNSHIGSEGVDEWELDDVEFDDFERIDVDSGTATYIISYFIRISGVSYEYWGRDDDTKEIITSPGRRHECSGKVEVLVTRALDTVINWNENFEYQDAEIETASITEDSYEDADSDFDIYCAECGKKMGYEWESFYRDYKGDPICDDCMTTNENGFVCPGCGEKCPEEMRGGSGTYCINCEEKYDV